MWPVTSLSPKTPIRKNTRRIFSCFWKRAGIREQWSGDQKWADLEMDKGSPLKLKSWQEITFCRGLSALSTRSVLEPKRKDHMEGRFTTLDQKKKFVFL